MKTLPRVSAHRRNTTRIEPEVPEVKTAAAEAHAVESTDGGVAAAGMVQPESEDPDTSGTCGTEQAGL